MIWLIFASLRLVLTITQILKYFNLRFFIKIEIYILGYEIKNILSQLDKKKINQYFIVYFLKKIINIKY